MNHTRTIQLMKEKLDQLKPNLTSECYETVKKTACLIVPEVCSDDGKYYVKLISKETCLANMKW